MSGRDMSDLAREEGDSAVIASLRAARSPSADLLDSVHEFLGSIRRVSELRGPCGTCSLDRAHAPYGRLGVDTAHCLPFSRARQRQDARA